MYNSYSTTISNSISMDELVFSIFIRLGYNNFIRLGLMINWFGFESLSINVHSWTSSWTSSCWTRSWTGLWTPRCWAGCWGDPRPLSQRDATSPSPQVAQRALAERAAPQTSQSQLQLLRPLPRRYAIQPILQLLRRALRGRRHVRA